MLSPPAVHRNSIIYQGDKLKRLDIHLSISLPVSPSPLLERGRNRKEEAKPPLKTTSPFPSRGRGIKGDRVNATEKRKK
jgi:hypothetical protein